MFEIDTQILRRADIPDELPFTLRDRPYIPLTDEDLEKNTEYHLLETGRRIERCSGFSWDVDAFVTAVSPIPYKADGTLDVEKLNKLSPYTMPIAERLALLSIHIPSIPNSGKSFMVEKTLYNMIHQIKYDFMVLYGMGRIEIKNNERIFVPDPAFIEPITGRMRARDTDGSPSKKLLQFGIEIFDNGGAFKDKMHPDGYYQREQFPMGFFSLLTNHEFQSLISRTTRLEKKKQQVEIMKFHDLFSDAAIKKRYPNGLPIFSLDYDTEYIRTGRLVAKDSYGSPHCKFNFDLDFAELSTNTQLQGDWELFFSRHCACNSQIRSFTDFQQHLDRYFNGFATVSSNYVPGNPEAGIGERMVIDLTPPGVNKGVGLMKAIDYMRREYSRAGLAYPSLFERELLKGGDGAHRDKNDFDFIYDEGGVTNTPNLDYVRIDGFPSHCLDIFDHFDITVTQQLDMIEETLVFTQLLLHARLGFPKNDLPSSTLAKLEFR